MRKLQLSVVCLIACKVRVGPDVQGDASSRVFVHNRQPLQCLTVRRPIEDKIPFPNVIDSRRTQAMAGMLGFACRSLFLSHVRYFQAFGFPEAMNSLEADPKYLQAKSSRQLPITETWMLSRELAQSLTNRSRRVQRTLVRDKSMPRHARRIETENWHCKRSTACRF